MQNAIGQNLLIGLQKESAYNTPNVTNLKGLYVRPNESMTETVSRADAGNARNTKYKMSNERKALLKSCEGSINGVIPIDGFGWVLNTMFETSSTDEGGSHFFLKNTSTDSYTLFMDRDNQYYTFAGCKPSGLNFDFSGEFPTWELALQGADVNDGASVAIPTVATDDNIFSRNEVTMKIGAAGSEADTEIPITGGSLSIAETNSDGEDVSYKLGNASRQRLLAIDVVPTGTFSFVYDKDTAALTQLETDVAAGTKRSLEFILTSGSDVQKIRMDNCDLSGYGAAIGDTNLRRVNVDFEAFSSTSTDAINFTIKDDYATSGYSW